MSGFEPIPPEDFDVDRQKPVEPTHYRDAAPEIPERFGQARGPIGRRSRPSGIYRLLLAMVALLLVGGAFAMCGAHRRSLDRSHHQP